MIAITKEDLNNAAGLNRFSFPALQSFLMEVLKINAFNKLMQNAAGLTGVEFADHLLDVLGISIEIEEADLMHIPRDGAFIAVSNHPYGAIESLALLSLLVKKRPETMFMGNFLLKKVPNLADYIIAVNPFENIADSSSISGLKTTLKTLNDGIPVAIFPAGEVSAFCTTSKKITDKEWHPVVGKIIGKANVPVLPIYFAGNNGIAFSLLRFIHPSLQTAMLLNELFNKNGLKLRVKIGEPIKPTDAFNDGNTATLLSHLRKKTYSLALK